MSSKRTLAQQSNVERARARRLLMQAVYQFLITQEDSDTILKNIKGMSNHNRYDEDFLDDGLTALLGHKPQLDLQLIGLTERPLEQVDLVDYSILLVAAYELNSKITPPKVAINEAIVLAKKFASEDSHKFINGVVDKIYQNLK